MNCQEVSLLLDAYVDGESLDAVRYRDIGEHLKSCRACQAKLDAIHATRNAVGEKGAYYRAPQHLVRNIAAIGEVEQERVKPFVDRWRYAWTFANLFLVACTAVVIAAMVTGRSTSVKIVGDGRLMESEILSAHVRSLQATHLFDVPSSDKHTVKPWFQGKLDFSPDVPNLASDGYPLLGGRLDVIDRHPVAALVYGRSKHRINVFVMPRSIGWNLPDTFSEDGYHMLHWIENGLDYCAVSDTDIEALKSFEKKFQGATGP